MKSAFSKNLNVIWYLFVKINHYSLFWQNNCFSLKSRMIDDRGSICNIYMMLIRARLSCHTVLALRQKSFFSRDNETTLHKLIQVLLKTPTKVSIPNSLAKQRKVLIQVLSYDHWFCTESFSSPVQTWCHEECKVLMNVLTALRRSNLSLVLFRTLIIRQRIKKVHRSITNIQSQQFT